MNDKTQQDNKIFASPCAVLEKVIYGRKSFDQSIEEYIGSPVFVRLLTLYSPVNHITSMRYTDTLKDFTTAVLWPEDKMLLPPADKKHDYFELVYVLTGTLQIRIEQNTYCFPSGSAFSLDLHVRNALLPSQYTAVFLGLSKNFFKRFPTEFEKSSYHRSQFIQHINMNLNTPYSSCHGFFTFKQKTLSPVEELLKQLQAELSEKKAGYSLILYGFIFRIFALLEDQTFYSMQYIDLDRYSTKRLANEMCNYLLQHPYHLTIAELSAELHYSQEYIRKIYKQYTGESILAANRRIYLERAQILLATTNLSISQICHQLHFLDRKSFYSVFEKTFGCTPRQYRLNHQNTDEQHIK